MLMHSGTPLQEMSFTSPQVALFFNRSPNKLIVACSDSIFVVDVSTKSKQSFSDTPQGVGYFSHALALSDDDSVLVAGNYFAPYSVCGYDTLSLARLWICDTAGSVVAVCMHSAHVLVTVYGSPFLVLNFFTGAQDAALQKTDGWIIGLGVIEGSCFVLSCS